MEPFVRRLYDVLQNGQNILGSTKREHQGDPGVSAHRWTDLRIPRRIQPAHRE